VVYIIRRTTKGGKEMRYLLNDIIDVLDFRELVKLRQDLDNGGIHLKKLVEENIREKKEKHCKFCVICGTRINPYHPNNLTMIIGPEDNQKKASFCAKDCMQYFLDHMNRAPIEEEVQDHERRG